jgi:hypothetical protein
MTLAVCPLYYSGLCLINRHERGVRVILFVWHHHMEYVIMFFLKNILSIDYLYNIVACVSWFHSFYCESRYLYLPRLIP